MKYEVILPSLGDALEEEAIVSIWFAQVGDILNEGDDLVELTTDKAAFTVPSPKTGTLIERMFDEDDAVKVDDILCVLEV